MSSLSSVEAEGGGKSSTAATGEVAVLEILGVLSCDFTAGTDEVDDDDVERGNQGSEVAATASNDDEVLKPKSPILMLPVPASMNTLAGFKSLTKENKKCKDCFVVNTIMKMTHCNNTCIKRIS